MTPRDENEKTTLVTGDCSLVTVETKTRYGLEGVTEQDRKPYTNNQQEGSVTAENDLITIDVVGVENGTLSTNVVAEVAVKNERSNEGVQSSTGYGLEGVTELKRTRKSDNQQETFVTVENDLITIDVDGPSSPDVDRENIPQNEGSYERVQNPTGYGLEGVTELPQTSYTNNQQEASVTEALKLENDKPFWWPKDSDRYALPIEVAAMTGYASVLASESFWELQEAKEQIVQLSQSLGWGVHELWNWLFERMPDEAIDYVE